MPGTTVLMADGTRKNIEDVQTGDQVAATDPESGDTRSRTVEAPRSSEGTKHLVEITIDTDGKHGDSTAQLTATDNHPFWIPDTGQWTNAGDLKPGTWLRTSAGTWIQITAIKKRTVHHQRVHNLTITGTHTYYVEAGSTPVLVHNCNVSPELKATADAGEMAQADFASEFISPSGKAYRAHNK